MVRRERAADFVGDARRINPWRRFMWVFFRRKVVVIGSVIILGLVIMAIFAPLLAPYDPNLQDLNLRLAQPSSQHLLGCDLLGRDTLSRLIYGARPALIIGIIAIGLAACIGMTLGLIAGYYGGILNSAIMRTMDALMTIPMLVLALVIAAVLGGGLKNVIIAVGIAFIPMYARLMCGQVLSAKERDYVTAGHAIGSTDARIMIRRILPNCLPPLIVQMTMMMGTAIMMEASLSFLGVGISPPAAAWGAMITDGYQYLLDNPILSVAPGLAIMLVVYAFNMVGDGLRDALDPRLRGSFDL